MHTKQLRGLMKSQRVVRNDVLKFKSERMQQRHDFDFQNALEAFDNYKKIQESQNQEITAGVVRNSVKTSLTRISGEHYIKPSRTRIDDVSTQKTNKNEDFAEDICEKPPQIEMITEPTKTKGVNQQDPPRNVKSRKWENKGEVSESHKNEVFNHIAFNNYLQDEAVPSIKQNRQPIPAIKVRHFTVA